MTAPVVGSEPSPPLSSTAAAEIEEHAFQLLRLMMGMVAGKGELPVPRPRFEGLHRSGVRDCRCAGCGVLSELRYDVDRPDWPERARFVLSPGHYSIALYAVLAYIGMLRMQELPMDDLNGSRLPLSAFNEMDGVEVTGGSLGQGLGQAVGMALGSTPHSPILTSQSHPYRSRAKKQWPRPPHGGARSLNWRPGSRAAMAYSGSSPPSQSLPKPSERWPGRAPPVRSDGADRRSHEATRLAGPGHRLAVLAERVGTM
jgi:hypothetical protein